MDLIHGNNQLLTHDWRDEVDLSDNIGQSFERFINMLSAFESMWEVYLGRISTARHYVKLNISNRPEAHSAPYRVGPKLHQFEKSQSTRYLSAAS